MPPRAPQAKGQILRVTARRHPQVDGPTWMRNLVLSVGPRSSGGRAESPNPAGHGHRHWGNAMSALAGLIQPGVAVTSDLTAL